MSKAPPIAGTLQTDPRSGGQTKKSGVNPLPEVAAGELDGSLLEYQRYTAM